MNVKQLFYILFLFIFLNSNAQKFELGKVTIEELQQKAHSKDTSAVAAILFQIGEVKYENVSNYGFITKNEVITKIKIYKKEGYNYANQFVNYFSDKNSFQISFKDAYTYNLVNGKIEKTKLEGEGKFNNKITKGWIQKIITMPNVREGSIIEFKYVVSGNGIGTPIKWNFQSKIPTDYSRYTTTIPEYFIFNKNQKGSIFPQISTQKVLESPKYEETKTVYTAINMPALKDEAYVNNIENYTSSISHELSAINISPYYYKAFANNWENITKEIYKIPDFNIELNKSGYFENEISTLLNGLNTRDEKILAILNFVKTKVKWNDNYGIFCDKGVRNAYKEGLGNVAEINLMLTSMLRFANIEANPILVSTRENGIVLFPSINAFDYVICAVEIEDDLILLDATDKNSLPNLLPIRDLNWNGRLIRKEGNSSAEVVLIPKFISKSITNVIASINSQGKVEGKIKEQHFDYNALNFRNDFFDFKEDQYIEFLEKKYKNIEISNYLVNKDDDLSKPVVETYSFEHNNYSEKIGDKIYFSPLLFLAQTENPFKQETREYPVDFIYANQDKYLISITIPDGYIVESLPESISISMRENLLGLKYLISNIDNRIQLTVTFDINTTIIPADYYPELKAVYTEIVKKETEKIVLKKA